MSGALAIRRAASPDAAVLSAIGRETFIHTFGHLYAPEDLAVFLDESHSVASYAALLDDPRYGLWLLEEAGEGAGARVVGFAVAGPCGLPHADVAPGDGELKRLYLLPEIQTASPR